MLFAVTRTFEVDRDLLYDDCCCSCWPVVYWLFNHRTVV